MTNIITDQEIETLGKLTKRSQYDTALAMLEGIFNDQAQNVSRESEKLMIATQISKEMSNADPLFDDLIKKFDVRIESKTAPPLLLI